MTAQIRYRMTMLSLATGLMHLVHPVGAYAQQVSLFPKPVAVTTVQKSSLPPLEPVVSSSPALVADQSASHVQGDSASHRPMRIDIYNMKPKEKSDKAAAAPRPTARVAKAASRGVAPAFAVARSHVPVDMVMDESYNGVLLNNSGLSTSVVPSAGAKFVGLQKVPAEWVTTSSATTFNRLGGVSPIAQAPIFTAQTQDAAISASHVTSADLDMLADLEPAAGTAVVMSSFIKSPALKTPLMPVPDDMRLHQDVPVLLSLIHI